MDFKSIIVNGETYNVKDETARSKANQNEENIGSLAEDSLTVSYSSESESIVFAKGIVIG